MPDGDPQQRLKETMNALTTIGSAPCLHGWNGQPDAYLEGDWQQHRYVLTDPRPAWARQTKGLPRRIHVIPGNPTVDNALRNTLNDWVYVYGRTQRWVRERVGSESYPEVMAYYLWPKDQAPQCPLVPLGPTAPTTPTAPTREQQLADRINVYLRQFGLPEITAADVNQWLPWLQQMGITIQLEDPGNPEYEASVPDTLAFGRPRVGWPASLPQPCGHPYWAKGSPYTSGWTPASPYPLWPAAPYAPYSKHAKW